MFCYLLGIYTEAMSLLPSLYVIASSYTLTDVNGWEWPQTELKEKKPQNKQKQISRSWKDFGFNLSEMELTHWNVRLLYIPDIISSKTTKPSEIFFQESVKDLNKIDLMAILYYIMCYMNYVLLNNVLLFWPHILQIQCHPNEDRFPLWVWSLLWFLPLILSRSFSLPLCHRLAY